MTKLHNIFYKHKLLSTLDFKNVTADKELFFYGNGRKMSHTFYIKYIEYKIKVFQMNSLNESLQIEHT